MAQDSIRRQRTLSAIGFIALLACLVYALELTALQKARETKKPRRPAPVTTSQPDDTTAATQAQLEQALEERDAALTLASNLRTQAEEERQINNALREDLKKATAKLRQQPAKGR